MGVCSYLPREPAPSTPCIIKERRTARRIENVCRDHGVHGRKRAQSSPGSACAVATVEKSLSAFSPRHHIVSSYSYISRRLLLYI